MLVAPATANTIAKMAHGQADNLLLTVFLSARCPVMIAPAMDLDMYSHSATQKNLEILTEMGVAIIDAATGDLASGLSGKGRMEDPERILEKVVQFLNEGNSRLPFSGKKVLLTAGPTYENIDPVRFIGNYSSGKMGLAIADALAAKGADVYLVLGPVSVKPVNVKVQVYPVVSANEMYEKCLSLFPEMDGAVMAAAVSDFTPAEPMDQKTKRGEDDLVIRLKPTRDIAAVLGEMKSPIQWLVGFALETQNENINARKKLEKKNLDMIVLNSLNDKGAGFGHDTNKITIIDKSGSVTAFGLKTKKEVAEDIVDHIYHLI
jgi:phosphopantothenoylcysteine decarboxylase/phosphopantothenate--cysteine ligase